MREKRRVLTSMTSIIQDKIFSNFHDPAMKMLAYFVNSIRDFDNMETGKYVQFNTITPQKAVEALILLAGMPPWPVDSFLEVIASLYRRSKPSFI